MYIRLIALFFCSCISSATFCADPYAVVKKELLTFMSPLEAETLIKEDEAARKNHAPVIVSLYAKPSSSNPVSIRIPIAKPMSDEERKAFRAKMVQNARNKQFGNTGGR